MEKRFLTAVLVTTFLLNGCVTDNGNYSSFQDVTGITISDINEFKISENVTASFAWQYQYDDYTFLNTKYVKVNFNIKNELLDKPLSDGGGAICLHFMTDVLLETYPVQHYSFDMYIGQKDHYLYYGSTMENSEEAYRSFSKIPDKYLAMIKDRTNKDGEYRLKVTGDLTISPDLPKTAHYPENHPFRFKVGHVLDATLYVYLNDELLKPFKEDPTLDGYSYYEFKMPALDSTLVITSNRFYLNKTYSFVEVFPYLRSVTKESLKGVRIETGYFGVNPEGNKPTIKYSEDKRDIEYNLDILNNQPLLKYDENQPIDGGNYRKVTYILFSEGEYEIEIENSHVVYRDFSSYQMFRFDSTPTKMPDIFYPQSN